VGELLVAFVRLVLGVAMLSAVVGSIPLLIAALVAYG
jgi:hypothetical protein